MNRLKTRHRIALYFSIVLLVAIVGLKAAPPQAGSSSEKTHAEWVQQPGPDGFVQPHALYTKETWDHFLDKTPNGPEKDLVKKWCGEMCHDQHRTTGYPRTRQQWQGTIESMYTLGMKPYNAEQMNMALDYLTKYFGPHAQVHINRTEPCVAQTPEEAAYSKNPTPGSYRVYINNQMDGHMEVIDPKLNKVVRRFNCIASPDLPAFSRDKKRIFIPDRAEYVVHVFDIATGKKIVELPVGDRVQNIIMSKDGKKLYAGIWQLRGDDGEIGYIEVWDTDTYSRLDTIITKGGIHDMELSPDGKLLITGSNSGKWLGVYDTATEKLVWEKQYPKKSGLINAVETPLVVPNPDGSINQLSVCLLQTGTLDVIDWKTKESKTVYLNDGMTGPAAGGCHGSAITPDEKEAWFAGGRINGSAYYALTGFSLPEWKKITRIEEPELDQLGQPYHLKAEGSWVGLSPDGKIAYHVHATGDVVSVVDLAQRKEIARIPVGSYPLRVKVLGY